MGKRVAFTIQLVAGDDNDLIQWLTALQKGERNATGKRLLRAALGLPDVLKKPLFNAVTEEDLNRELDKLTGDFREYVKLEIQKALNSLDYAPVSKFAPVETEKVDEKILAERKTNIMKDDW